MMRCQRLVLVHSHIDYEAQRSPRMLSDGKAHSHHHQWQRLRVVLGEL